MAGTPRNLRPSWEGQIHFWAAHPLLKRRKMSWSSDRANVFIVHSWEEPEAHRRMVELLSNQTTGLAHYSIPAWRPLEGPRDEVAASIRMRIQMATAVVVLNTPGLHKRDWSRFEMETAAAMGKRIVVVQPHHEYDLPIPGALRDKVYYLAPWRGDVVGRAIRGEYPPGQPVYDIAEVADRRRLVGYLAAAVTAVSVYVVGTTAIALDTLRRDMAAQGMELRLDAVGTVAGFALIGAGVGLFLGALSGDEETMLCAAGAGAAAGAAVGIRRVYTAKLTEARGMQLLTLTP